MRGTSNRKAFEAYLVGERKYSILSKKDMMTSQASFEKATTLDPKFARAWGWRAYVHLRFIKMGWLPKNEMGKAIEWAERAVQLDSNDYATHWDLAYCLIHTEDFMRGLACFKRALHLYDNFTDMLDRKPGLLAEAAVAFIQVGRPQEAIKLLRRATRVPDWYRWNFSWAYFNAGEYENAIRQIDLMDLKPGQELYVVEFQIFLAAACVMRAEELDRQKDPSESEKMRQRAKDAIGRLRAGRPKFGLADVRTLLPAFKRKSDEDRWFAALREAGLR